VPVWGAWRGSYGSQIHYLDAVQTRGAPEKEEDRAILLLMSLYIYPDDFIIHIVLCWAVNALVVLQPVLKKN
jgi:hypothetical protein